MSLSTKQTRQLGKAAVQHGHPDPRAVVGAVLLGVDQVLPIGPALLHQPQDVGSDAGELRSRAGSGLTARTQTTGGSRVEGLGPHRRVPESWSRFSSSRAALWRCSPWPAAAGLGGDGNASAESKSSAELVESLGRYWPEPEGVDGEDCVEGTTEGGRQLIDRGPAQADPSGGDGGGVTTGRKIQGDSEGQECRLRHRSPPGPADRRRRSASWVSHAQ